MNSKNYSINAGGLKLPTEDALFRMLQERSNRKKNNYDQVLKEDSEDSEETKEETGYTASH